MSIFKKALFLYLLYLSQIYLVLLGLTLLLVPVAMLQWQEQQCWLDCTRLNMNDYVIQFIKYILLHEQVKGYWTYFPHLCVVAMLFNRWFKRLLK